MRLFWAQKGMQLSNNNSNNIELLIPNQSYCGQCFPQMESCLLCITPYCLGSDPWVFFVWALLLGSNLTQENASLILSSALSSICWQHTNLLYGDGPLWSADMVNATLWPRHTKHEHARTRTHIRTGTHACILLSKQMLIYTQAYTRNPPFHLHVDSGCKERTLPLPDTPMYCRRDLLLSQFNVNTRLICHVE